MALVAGWSCGGRVPPGLCGVYNLRVVLPGFLLCCYTLLWLPGWVPLFCALVLVLVTGVLACFWVYQLFLVVGWCRVGVGLVVVLLLRVRLQVRQRIWRLSRWSVPPFECGVMWSASALLGCPGVS